MLFSFLLVYRIEERTTRWITQETDRVDHGYGRMVTLLEYLCLIKMKRMKQRVMPRRKQINVQPHQKCGAKRLQLVLVSDALFLYFAIGLC